MNLSRIFRWLLLVFLLLVVLGDISVARDSRISPQVSARYFLVVASSTASQKIKAGADYPCDGTVDDVQIQAALNAMTADGGTVVCSEGDYSIRSTITIPSNTILEFSPGSKVTLDGANATLTENTTDWNMSMYPMFTNSDHTNGNTRIRVIGLNLDGDGDNVTANRSYAGVWFHNCTESSVEDSRFYNIYFGAGPLYYKAFGTLFSLCTDCDVFQCYAEHIGYEGFGIRGANIRCKISYCSGTDFYAHLAQIAQTSGSANFGLTKDCVIDHCSTGEASGGSDRITVHAGLSELAITGVNTTTDTFTVAGNKSAQFKVGMMFTVEGSTGNDGEWTVESMTVATNTNVVVTGDITDATVDGNITFLIKDSVISNCDADVIYFLDHVKGLRIENCRIRSSLGGLHATGTSSSNIQISNNRINPNSSDIGFMSTLTGSASIDGISFIGNTFEGGQLKFTTATTPTSTLKNVNIQGNSFVGPGADSGYLAALYLDNAGTGNWSQIAITDNIFSGWLKYSCIWFRLTSSGDILKSIVSNNYMESTYHGLKTSSSSTGVIEDVLFSGNYVYIGQDVIEGCSLLSNVLISGNYIDGAANPNLVVDVGGTNIIVDGNYIENLQVSPILNAAVVGGIIGRNYGTEAQCVAGTIPISSGTTDTITVLDSLNFAIYTNEGTDGTTHYDLPAAVAGMVRRFCRVDYAAGQDVEIDPSGTEHIYLENGTDCGAGTYRGSDKGVDAYYEITFECFKTGSWRVVNEKGTGATEA